MEITKKNTIAGIVSYNPNMKSLKENIDAILPQVDRVIVFDNGSINQSEILKNAGKYVEVIISNVNLGIAGALNKIMQYAYENNYYWVVTLDQDSVFANGLLEKLANELPTEENIGIIAPTIIDRNTGVVGHNPKERIIKVRTCITSGSVTSVMGWKKVGGFDEVMFIDSVDFEYCYRLRKNGFLVMQVRDAKLLHSLGESRSYRLFFIKINHFSHSAVREFYIAQNRIYYPRKHHLPLHFIRGNLRNIKSIISIFLFENGDFKKIKSILCGWKSGYRLKTK